MAGPEQVRDERLVFDLGMHRGEDVAFYLKRGFSVVAVDADPTLVQAAARDFQDAVASGQLRVIHAAVVARGGEEADFYVSQFSAWSSLALKISTREGMTAEKLRVPTVDLPLLFKCYGVPYYCKIDLEATDLAAVESLERASARPRFLSAETECIGEAEVLDETTALAVLDALNALGYSRFKLVDQRSLAVLRPSVSFYPQAEPFHPPVERRRLPIVDTMRDPYARTARRLRRRFGHAFPHGASGPFGEDLKGEWLDYDTARTTLLFHRSEYFSLRKAVAYQFWCDWHATF